MSMMVLGALQQMKMTTMLRSTMNMFTSFHSFLCEPNGIDLSLLRSAMILRLMVRRAMKGMITVKKIL